MSDPIAMIDEERILRYFEGTLGGVELSAFSESLAQDPALAYKMALLGVVRVMQIDQQIVTTDEADEPIVTPADPVALESPAPHTYRIRRYIAAAILLIAVGLWAVVALSTVGRERPIAPRTESTIATLVGAQNVRWVTEPRYEGDSLAAQTLLMDKGAVGVMLDSGAYVSARGACEINLDGRNHVTLRRGEVRTVVPPGAVGFTTRLGSFGSIVDLGTRFVARVQPSDFAEVGVVEGRVRVELPGRVSEEPIIEELTVGQYAVLRPQEGRILVDSVRPSATVSLDTNDADQVTAADGAPLATMTWIGSPKRIEGLSGQAIRFDGKGSRIALGTSSLVPRTGSFGLFAWVRIDRNDAAGAQYLIGNYAPLVTGRFALRLIDGRFGYFIEERDHDSGVDVADGRWHHVGITRSDGDRMTFWIDGEPIDAGADASTIATSLSWSLGGRKSDTLRSYAGEMDHVVAFDHEPPRIAVDILVGLGKRDYLED